MAKRKKPAPKRRRPARLSRRELESLRLSEEAGREAEREAAAKRERRRTRERPELPSQDILDRQEAILSAGSAPPAETVLGESRLGKTWWHSYEHFFLATMPEPGDEIDPDALALPELDVSLLAAATRVLHLRYRKQTRLNVFISDVIYDEDEGAYIWGAPKWRTLVFADSVQDAASQINFALERWTLQGRYGGFTSEEFPVGLSWFVKAPSWYQRSKA